MKSLYQMYEMVNTCLHESYTVEVRKFIYSTHYTVNLLLKIVSILP